MKPALKNTLLSILLAVLPMIAEAQYDKDVFFFRGRRALADGKYAQAIENFNVLSRIDSTDHWTFFYRGIAKYNLGDIRGAQKDFNNSVRLNPVFTSGYHYKAITESRAGDYEKALEDLQRAIDLRPGYEGLYFSRGVTYFLAQQFDKAVSDFDRYIRKEPKDPSAYLNRGASKLFLKDTLSALEDYNKAISLDRFEPEGFIRRGRLYAARKQYPEAIADMNMAIGLDTANTFAYFNRAIMYYEQSDYNAAMSDLNRVLADEPGNALTLYNRSLINAQIGNLEEALQDMDRVIGINPGNVLAYFNRASVFVQMERWRDALEDYDKAIELYPDFAKAYLNRSYVENMLGMKAESKQDYDTARRKVSEYRAKNAESEGSFADTTRKYSSLLALDAEFAKKDFDNEMLQHRDIDVKLRPLYRFVLADSKDNVNYALRFRYENALIDRMLADSPLPLAITSSDTLKLKSPDRTADRIYSLPDNAESEFLKALQDIATKQFNSAMIHYGNAVDKSSDGKYGELYKAFYYMNRAVLRADMIEFISSIENNVQTLTMDDQGTTRARVKDQVSRGYDYSDALEDVRKAAEIVDNIPYIHFNLGNLLCLSSSFVEAIDSYSKAIRLYPYMGDAYFNRGLVLIYLKDKEKGCIDLSHAGELGVSDAYGVIKKYCEEAEQ
ncbi:MAG: tetratricopeptide repeat protein [Candidatus Cryptobacteroides sp.]|nr:tetratricopeptide repeat protein [Candidatus Cryptobacteroides sp.]